MSCVSSSKCRSAGHAAGRRRRRCGAWLTRRRTTCRPHASRRTLIGRVFLNVFVDAAARAAPLPAAEERKVLEEDEYLDVMETIIERDFFPDLPRLERQRR